MIGLRLREIAAAVQGQIVSRYRRRPRSPTGWSSTRGRPGRACSSRRCPESTPTATSTPQRPRRRRGGRDPGHPGGRRAGVIVPDVAAAWARSLHTRCAALPQVRVIALTGSSGKTSTKDLVAALLEPAGPTIAPPGSYNNDLGVPLTVLRADAATRFLVLEMGARGRGHIARLCAIAPPSIGVVLNVGSAHLGEFGSRRAIAESKGELAEAARDVAVLNADDPLVLRDGARAPGLAWCTFGESRDRDVARRGGRASTPRGGPASRSSPRRAARVPGCS